jgi:hypothetical protein
MLQAFDEDHVVEDPPFRDSAGEEIQDRLVCSGYNPASAAPAAAGETGCEIAITAASNTSGWETTRVSISIEEIHSPPELKSDHTSNLQNEFWTQYGQWTRAIRAAVIQS